MRLRECCRSLLFVTVLLLTAGACEEGKKSNGTSIRRQVEDAMEDVETGNTFTATVQSVSGDSMTVKDIVTGDVQTLCYGRAQVGNNFKGSVAEGCTLSVQSEPGTKDIRSAVNVSELEGLWIYDSAQRRGMRFGIDGSLSSVNMRNVSLRSWHIRNGKLVVYYVDMQQKARSEDEYWVDESEIVSLNGDKLELRMLDTLLVCHRQRAALKFQGNSGSKK